MPIWLNRFLHCVRASRSATRSAKFQSNQEQVRTALLLALTDCAGPTAEHLRLQIRRARSENDLWMLRSNVYRLIALNHCQSIADERTQAPFRAIEERTKGKNPI